MVCYDDRYILRLAADTDGVVVSNDNYRDLVLESPEFRKIVEERILMYSFVNDRFMPPDDPLGRNGPKLDRFLRKPASSSASGFRSAGDASNAGLAPQCPYGKKCTYGNKCKYYHPERGNVPQKTITERLAEQAQRQLSERQAQFNAVSAGAGLPRAKAALVRESKQTLSLPLPSPSGSSSSKPSSPVKKTPLARTKSIVPTLSLLPPELIEERPVQDLWPSSTSTATLDPVDRTIPKSRSVENMAKTTQAQRQQQHEAMLRPPPKFSVPPPVAPAALDWTRIGGQQPQGSKHVPLCQRLSDPVASPMESPRVMPKVADDPATTSYNPHRKVERQLTLNPLNPNCDPRIHAYKLKGLAPPYPPPPFASAVHQHHTLVTRNASAPVPASQLCPPSHQSVVPSGGSHHMQRLNSTSDTQLNLYGGALASSQDWIHDPFDEWTKSPPPPLPSAAPAQQQQLHPWAGRTTSLPAHHHLSSSPVQQSKQSPVLFSDSSSSSVTEARYKLFFHLAAIFPEDQVRQVMHLMPDETNAQKICAAILSLYPKEN